MYDPLLTEYWGETVMAEMYEIIHIYHTNDIHSHFENWPQIRRFLRTRKSENEAAGDGSFAFDIGDHVDRSHPFTEGTNGLGNVALLNSAGYDAVTIGNNEGITLPKNTLNTLYIGADFDVIVGNLFEMDDTLPKWAAPYKIYVTPKGTRVGVIGATAEYALFYSKLGWSIKEPREQLKKIAKSIEKETDLLICLSHMGVNEDRLLAVECDSIDIILGAHTHHLFEKGERVNKSLLAATGKYGEYVGHVTIQFNEKGKFDSTAEVYKTADLEFTKEDAIEVNEVLEDGKRSLEKKVFYNAVELPFTLFEASPLSTFFGKAMLAYTEADCALFNAGIFLGSLHEGWVTKGDLHTLLPHPINPCVITLDGTALAEVYELSLNPEWPAKKIKGLGFRGDLMGAMIYEKLGKNDAGELVAGNRKVVPEESYTVATLDMFTFGFFFPSLKEAEKEYYMPELIRDVFGWYGSE